MSVQSTTHGKSMRATFGALLAFLAIAVIIASFMAGRFDIGLLKSLVSSLEMAEKRAPLLFMCAYFGAYVAATGLCIPLEVPFAMGAGALFGLRYGVAVASFASIFGATIAFSLARHFLREPLRRRFPTELAKIDRGIDRDGVFYLVNLRLTPVVPFSICNPLLGLTNMPLPVFFVVSQISMIFATIVFVNAGTQLMALHSFREIMSAPIVIGLGSLAVLPVLGKMLLRGVNMVRHRPISAR